MSNSVTLWTVAHQVPLYMGFLKQEYWSGLPCPPPGESSWLRDWTYVSYVSCIGRWILYQLSHQVSPKEYISNSKYPSQHLEFLYSLCVCVCVCMCVYSTSISTNIKVLYGDYLHSPLPHNVLYSPFWLGYLYHIYISFIKYFWSLASYLID